MGRGKKSPAGGSSSAATANIEDEDALLNAAMAEVAVEVAAMRASGCRHEIKRGKASPNANRSLLHGAREQNMKAMSHALDRGADVRVLVNDDKSTDILFLSLLSFDYDIAEQLINGGFPLTYHAGPLLNVFCRRLTMAQILGEEENEDDSDTLSNRETIQLLLKQGADPNLKEKGVAPMFDAISTANGPDEDGEIVRMLLEARVNPNEPMTDESGCLALIYAAQQGNARVMTLLLEAGAHINAHPAYEAVNVQDASFWSRSSYYQERLQQQTMETATALFAAGRVKNYNVVRLLLERRADPDIPARHGLTPLCDAIYRLDEETKEGCERDVAHIRLLIGAKARLDAGEESVWSPLIQAIKRQAAQVVEILLAAGAPIAESLDKVDKCACGCRGDPWHGPQTPLSVASSDGLEGIVAMLIDRGVIKANRSSARRALRVARDVEQRSIARMIKAELCRCALCGKEARMKGFACPGCNEVYYCSGAHRQEHESRHNAIECADLRTMAQMDRTLTNRFQLKSELFNTTRAFSERAGCAACNDVESKAVDECSVCYDEMNEYEDEITTLPCGHQLHADCMARWFHKQSTCPLCRPA